VDIILLYAWAALPTGKYPIYALHTRLVEPQDRPWRREEDRNHRTFKNRICLIKPFRLYLSHCAHRATLALALLFPLKVQSES
jgi:hypothetical protein